jgi:hypothetical protein
MPVNDLYRAVFTYNYQGVTCNNVLYFRSKQANLTAQILATNIQINFRTSWRGASTPASTLVNIQTLKVSDTSGENGFYNYAAGTVGTLTGEGVPRILAAVLSLRTAAFGRRKRGRLYHTGFPLSMLSNGVISASGRTTLEGSWGSFFNLYKSGGNDGNWEVGVYSKATGGHQIPFTLPGFQAYTHWSINTEVGTERGRKS